MPDLLYEKRGHIAVFSINRPERLNATGRQFALERDEALADFAADAELRVGIVTGVGRAFSAGGDLKEMAEERARTPDWPGYGMRLYDSYPWFHSPKPLIGAINGLCLGGGMAVALDLDIRICSSEAYFSLPEPRFGLQADYSVHHLPHMIGMSAANYVLLTAERVSAEQALAWGIVTEVLPPERLLPRALAIAAMIASNAPLSMQGTKAAIQLWRHRGIDAGYRLQDWVGRVVRASEDAAEGARAQAARRPPLWRGR